MTSLEFIEKYYGERYTSKIDAPTRLLNTTSIQDNVSYGKNVIRIALSCLLNPEACYIIRYRVFTEVIENAYPELFEDDDVWEGNANFPGLHKITLGACVKLLIDPDPDVQHVLAHSRLISTESAATEKWWISTLEELRSQSIDLYKIGCLLFPLKKDPNVCATLMDLPMDTINALLMDVYTIALEHALREQTQRQEQNHIAFDTQWIRQQLEELIENENDTSV